MTAQQKCSAFRSSLAELDFCCHLLDHGGGQPESSCYFAGHRTHMNFISLRRALSLLAFFTVTVSLLYL